MPTVWGSGFGKNLSLDQFDDFLEVPFEVISLGIVQQTSIGFVQH
jgi:hypothetical protein